MREMTSRLSNLLYYKKLPQIYREEDSKIEYPLKRYLEALIEGGFDSAIKDIEGLMLIIDPKNTPESIFPFLCESFGLEYFPDIDITYQRKFLLNIGELIKRRGTFSSVHFLIKVLTGLESELELEDTTLTITLLARSVEEISLIEPSIRVIENYIKTQIPYYITPVILSRVDSQIINSKSYAHGALTSRKTYTIDTHKEVN